MRQPEIDKGFVFAKKKTLSMCQHENWMCQPEDWMCQPENWICQSEKSYVLTHTKHSQPENWIFSTNIMTIDQLSGYSGDASSKVWSRILKFTVTFACHIFSVMHLQNNFIKHRAA